MFHKIANDYWLAWFNVPQIFRSGKAIVVRLIALSHDVRTQKRKTKITSI
jgi:hypothetical protein